MKKNIYITFFFLLCHTAAFACWDDFEDWADDYDFDYYEYDNADDFYADLNNNDEWGDDFDSSFEDDKDDGTIWLDEVEVIGHHNPDDDDITNNPYNKDDDGTDDKDYGQDWEYDDDGDGETSGSGIPGQMSEAREPGDGTANDLSEEEKMAEIQRIKDMLELDLRIKLLDSQYSKEGKGYAYYKDGLIYVKDSWFSQSDNDKMVILYHEYFHSQNDLFVRKDETGFIYEIRTDEKIKYSEAEIEMIKKNCHEDALLTPVKIYEENCIKDALNEMYIYTPSNYYLNEINAHYDFLEKISDGILSISTSYNDMCLLNLQDYKWAYERALDYEKRHGYNSDGTKKNSSN